jgi:hypothetical protein
MRRGATPFPQLAIPASAVTFEYDDSDGNWFTFAKVPSVSQETIWEDWNVYLEDLPESCTSETRVRIQLITRFPAPTSGASSDVENWHKAYGIEVLRAGLIETGNAERLRRMNVAKVKKLPDGEIQLEAIWESNVASVAHELKLEAVVMTARTIDVAPGVGVFPGTVVATTTNVQISRKRSIPAGNSLFDYKWVDFRDRSNTYSSGQLFAVDLETLERPTVVLNSEIEELRGILTINEGAIAGFPRIKKIRGVLERSLASMIAESVGPSIASRLVEGTIEAVEGDLTRESIEDVDFSEVIASLEPHVRTVAEAWSSWMSPRGGKKTLELMCREIVENFTENGSIAFHSYLHDQLPRQLRGNLKAEDSIREILAMAEISELTLNSNSVVELDEGDL